jgi:hypothetical protein
MLITTVLTFFVLRYGWKYPLWICLLSTGFFFVIDLAFFSANRLKLFGGGGFALMIGGLIFTRMMTCKQGRALLSAKQQAEAMELPSFLDAVIVAPPHRVEGTAVFLTAETGTVPNALLRNLRHNLKHNKVLHEQNLFVTVKRHEVPWIGLGKRLAVERPGHNSWPAGDPQRLQERPRCAAGPGRHARARLPSGAHDHQLLPVARRDRAHHRRRHGALARKTVCADAPQRRRGGRVSQFAQQRSD